MLEQDRWTAVAQHPVADFGHLEAGRHLVANALELTLGFKLRDKIAEIGVLHPRPGMGYENATPANTAAPTQLLCMNALKQPSRVRLRIKNQ